MEGLDSGTPGETRSAGIVVTVLTFTGVGFLIAGAVLGLFVEPLLGLLVVVGVSDLGAAAFFRRRAESGPGAAQR